MIGEQTENKPNHKVVHYSHISNKWYKFLFKKEKEASVVIFYVQLRTLKS